MCTPPPTLPLSTAAAASAGPCSLRQRDRELAHAHDTLRLARGAEGDERVHKSKAEDGEHLVGGGEGRKGGGGR
eukprot:81590-Chlamydomonas_euryale.AAC.1